MRRHPQFDCVTVPGKGVNVQRRNDELRQKGTQILPEHLIVSRELYSTTFYSTFVFGLNPQCNPLILTKIQFRCQKEKAQHQQCVQSHSFADFDLKNLKFSLGLLKMIVEPKLIH